MTEAAAELLERVIPRGERLIVTKPGIEHESTVGSLILPDSARKTQYGIEATVLKVGPGCQTEFVPGDKLIVGEFAGTPVHLDGDIPFYLIGEGDVMLIVRNA